MRYYNIVVTDAQGNLALQYTSQTRSNSPNINAAGGLVSDPGALEVELDIPATYYSAPISQALIKIKGIPYSDIAQSKNLNGLLIKVYAGMAKGLPLANPKQAGLVLQGMIFQAFGNWVGTIMDLDLVVTADGGTAEAPRNIVFNCPANTPLSGPIASTLSTAFPEYSAPQVNISDRLSKAEPMVSNYPSVEQFARMLLTVSKGIITDANYSGVQMFYRANQWIVFDSTAPSAVAGGNTADNPTPISFFDIIGQPTWFQPQSITFDCTLRADLAVGQFIRMPPGPVTTLAASQPQARDSSTMKGTFQIDLVRHVGNSRRPEAEAWVTTIQAHQLPEPSLAFPNFGG
jgi:hypothetical protein